MGSSHHSTPPRLLSDHVDLPSSSTPGIETQHRALAQSFTPNSASTHSSAPRWKSSGQRQASLRPVYSRLHLRGPSIWRWMLIITIFVLTFHLYRSLVPHDPLSTLPSEWRNDKTLSPILQPVTPESKSKRKKHDPAQWLKDHSSFDSQFPNSYTTRPRAALISLVRNEELDGILQSIRHLEYHWNRRYRYPWIFFNEKPFSEEFKVGLLPFYIWLYFHPADISWFMGCLGIEPLSPNPCWEYLFPLSYEPLPPNQPNSISIVRDGLLNMLLYFRLQRPMQPMPLRNTMSSPASTGIRRPGSIKPGTWMLSTTLARLALGRVIC